MDAIRWNKETRQAYVGTLLYSLLGILASILTPIAAAGSLMSAASGSSGGGFLGVLLILVQLCVIAGYVMFFLAVKDLKEITEGEDQAAFKKVYLSIIFSILASLCSILHFPVVPGICSIVACILLILGYNELKKSAGIAAFSPIAAKGFKRLFTAEILIIIGVVIGWIPLIGNVFGAIISVVAWIMILLGWKAVATPVAVEGKAPEAEKPITKVIAETVSESVEELKEEVRERIEKE